MILNRGLLIAGAIPLPWNNYSNCSFQRWLKCSHLAVFAGTIPVSAYGLGPTVNRKLHVCLLCQLPEPLKSQTWWTILLPDMWLSLLAKEVSLQPCGLTIAAIWWKWWSWVISCNTKVTFSSCKWILMWSLRGQNIAVIRALRLHPEDPDTECTLLYYTYRAIYKLPFIAKV